MQSNEIILTNTRTFPEIWGALTGTQRDDLCIKLFQRKCAKSRQGIIYWGKGQRKPANPLVRDAVADVVSKFLGERCLAATLFPES